MLFRIITKHVTEQNWFAVCIVIQEEIWNEGIREKTLFNHELFN
jgi:hypothetical protein